MTIYKTGEKNMNDVPGKAKDLNKYIFQRYLKDQ